MSIILPNVDEIWYLGDSISIDFDLSEGENPLDLTGVDEITFTMKLSMDDADNDFSTIQKTVGNGIEVLNAVEGQILITLDPSDTTSYREATTFVFDIQLTIGTDKITAGDGTITLVPDVTQG